MRAPEAEGGRATAMGAEATGAEVLMLMPLFEGSEKPMVRLVVREARMEEEPPRGVSPLAGLLPRLCRGRAGGAPTT